jgi:hypothetical protein
MLENFILALVNRTANILNGHIEFFSQSFISYTIKQSSFEHFSVSFGIPANYPLVDKVFPLTP